MFILSWGSLLLGTRDNPLLGICLLGYLIYVHQLSGGGSEGWMGTSCHSDSPNPAAERHKWPDRCWENDVPWQEAQSDSTSLCPKNCILTSRNTPTLLQALVIVVLWFKSYLSDSLSCEIFSLLTLKQRELNANNLHKVRKQFVLGLPGTGKTIVAFKIIDIIKKHFLLFCKEILSICANQLLRGFVR